MDKIKKEKEKEIAGLEEIAVNEEEKDENESEEGEEESKEKKSKKKLYIGMGIVGTLVLGGYLGGSFYYNDKFLARVEINNISVEANTVSEAKEKLNNSVENYELIIREKGKVEKIKGTDINLQFDGEEELKKMMENQNPLFWISGYLNPIDKVLDNAVTYDEQNLNKKIDGLQILKKENRVKAKDASFKYNGEGFEIIDEVKGNEIDKEKLVKEIKNAIKNGQEELDIEKLDIYKSPKYTKDSKEVKEAKEELDKMMNVQISYTYGGKTLELDKKTLGDAISVDKNMKPMVKEDVILEYTKSLENTFETAGRNRKFKNSYGNEITIGGGNFGYIVDRKETQKEILNGIKNIKNINKEPIFKQTGNVGSGNDIGNSYVEISLDNQHIWYYKNGKLLTEGKIVTGNLSRGWGTPAGVYKLTYKQLDAVLRGEDYATPVKFWMPFNGGIGLHDATWRGEFGGSIYRTNGSHGCVNLPYNVAQTIYNNIDGSMPIILY
ncbi:MAG: L,D-transpeptidase family protein [Clostridium sp.]|uniref:L,D-transpeptidase family protein n=1 Tax=Clostridium sp. TaxID=1506 RepID=UPI003F2E4942